MSFFTVRLEPFVHAPPVDRYDPLGPSIGWVGSGTPKPTLPAK